MTPMTTPWTRTNPWITADPIEMGSNVSEGNTHSLSKGISRLLDSNISAAANRLYPCITFGGGIVVNDYKRSDSSGLLPHAVTQQSCFDGEL